MPESCVLIVHSGLLLLAHGQTRVLLQRPTATSGVTYWDWLMFAADGGSALRWRKPTIPFLWSPILHSNPCRANTRTLSRVRDSTYEITEIFLSFHGWWASVAPAIHFIFRVTEASVVSLTRALWTHHITAVEIRSRTSPWPPPAIPYAVGRPTLETTGLPIVRQDDRKFCNGNNANVRCGFCTPFVYYMMKPWHWRNLGILEF